MCLFFFSLRRYLGFAQTCKSKGSLWETVLILAWSSKYYLYIFLSLYLLLVLPFLPFLFLSLLPLSFLFLLWNQFSRFDLTPDQNHEHLKAAAAAKKDFFRKWKKNKKIFSLFEKKKNWSGNWIEEMISGETVSSQFPVSNNVSQTLRENLMWVELLIKWDFLVEMEGGSRFKS